MTQRLQLDDVDKPALQQHDAAAAAAPDASAAPLPPPVTNWKISSPGKQRNAEQQAVHDLGSLLASLLSLVNEDGWNLFPSRNQPRTPLVDGRFARFFVFVGTCF